MTAERVAAVPAHRRGAGQAVVERRRRSGEHERGQRREGQGQSSHATTLCGRSRPPAHPASERTGQQSARCERSRGRGPRGHRLLGCDVVADPDPHGDLALAHREGRAHLPPGPSQWPPERSVRRKRATVHPRTSTARSSAAPQGSDSFHCRTAIRVRRRSGSGPLRTMTGREKNEAAASSWSAAPRSPSHGSWRQRPDRRAACRPADPRWRCAPTPRRASRPDPPPPPPPQPASAGRRAPSARNAGASRHGAMMAGGRRANGTGSGLEPDGVARDEAARRAGLGRPPRAGDPQAAGVEAQAGDDHVDVVARGVGRDPLARAGELPVGVSEGREAARAEGRAQGVGGRPGAVVAGVAPRGVAAAPLVRELGDLVARGDDLLDLGRGALGAAAVPSASPFALVPGTVLRPVGVGPGGASGGWPYWVPP